jgi:Protein of unknown function (DUF3159)
MLGDRSRLLSGWWQRFPELIVTAAPSLAFVVANAATSLDRALVVAGVTAVACFLWQIHRDKPLKQALLGLVVVGACAGAATITGQARGFFLLPMLVPFVVLTACVVSLFVNRPLTGLLFNRVSGGPADWREIPRLRRIYTATTIVSAVGNLISAIVQVALYAANQTVALAGVHVVTGPANAALIATTIVLARRAIHAPTLATSSP